MAKRGRPTKEIRVIEIPKTDVLPTEVTSVKEQIPEVPNGYEKHRIEKIRREFTIRFDTIPERVVCPYCHRLQFTLNEGPTNASIIRICDKCGSKTTFVFVILPFGLSTLSPLQ